ncbi:DNA integrity scanning protein DisA nucleotide-binding domain protein [Aquihabitans sp. G128]|uniref:diadenylate cyclase n=1 Tax=Aquihabitans sp. G128 TaxID=2849779 RepID=UPI001C250429|nr:diadenylate cyclase [Aquihabitans sp. G128]QXC59623.1 DNA integrity scanning protein DisA nucleotide-binding domain protein [Aquihabitans sp. G128]
MGMRRPSTENQLRRLVEELSEVGLHLDGSAPWHEVAIAELDYALRPAVHERRVPSYGAVVGPTTPSATWSDRTELGMSLRPVDGTPVERARPYADGIVSWLLRRTDGCDDWAVFDRPAGSERDLVVLAEAFGACIVQRHPSGVVRLAGDFGVYRWDGLAWHHEPLVSAWLDAVSACSVAGDRDVLETLLEFAVHDLGARGIGATLVYRPDDALPTSFEDRLPIPPPLNIRKAADLAPLRHVLAQVDGATLFDEGGVLRRIGVRLVPTPEAEAEVDGYRGTRHTAGRRYSYDDPSATVIVVSEDGPVTVLRKGSLLGASAMIDEEGDEPDD